MKFEDDDTLNQEIQEKTKELVDLVYDKGLAVFDLKTKEVKEFSAKSKSILQFSLGSMSGNKDIDYYNIYTDIMSELGVA